LFNVCDRAECEGIAQGCLFTDNFLVNTCVACATHDGFACSDNDVYWFDTCGDREERKEECGSGGCADGVCLLTQPTCTDTDGGQDYFAQGTVSGVFENGQGFTRTDSCTAPSALLEWYCSQSFPEPTSAGYYCPNGCLNGTCLPSTDPTCIPANLISYFESIPGTLGESFGYKIGIEGTQPVSVSITNLPSGLGYYTIRGQTSYIIDGTPDQLGTFTVTITARNDCGTDNRELIITISEPDPNAEPSPFTPIDGTDPLSMCTLFGLLCASTLVETNLLIGGLNNVYAPTVLEYNGVNRMWIGGWLTEQDYGGDDAIYYSEFKNGAWTFPVISFSKPGFLVNDPTVIQAPSSSGIDRSNWLYMYYTALDSTTANPTEDNVVGFASSIDGGKTWTDHGIIIEKNNGFNDCGPWAPSAIINGQEIWLYYHGNDACFTSKFLTRLILNGFEVIDTQTITAHDLAVNVDVAKQGEKFCSRKSKPSSNSTITISLNLLISLISFFRLKTMIYLLKWLYK